jgi:tyrosine-protein phosphatase SIW14
MPELRSLKVPLVGVFAVALALGCAPRSWSQATAPTPPTFVSANPVLKLDGLPNFGRVTEMLYRGGQPNAKGFANLQKMGIAVVVNLRDEPAETSKEKPQVESLGMKYVGIPWNGEGQPTNAQLVQFLDLLHANPQTKIFVHCLRGADRTGVMIAAYRIALEHTSVPVAVSEMYQFHYWKFLLPHLERYVDALPKLLDGDAQFSAYASPAPVAPNSAAGVVPTFSTAQQGQLVQ